MDEGNRFKDLLAWLYSLRGDLANVTAPPAFQAPASSVELPLCWAQRPEIFIAPALEPDSLKRHLRVLELVLYGLKDQYYFRLDKRGSCLKPLNAFLGELFLAEWTDEHGTVRLLSEQVSHHPPITAAYVGSEEHGIRAIGHTRVEMTFKTSLVVKQTGHIVVHVDKYDDDYLLPFPSCKMKGLLSKLYPELSGTHYIVSSEFISEITFSGEGFLSDTGKRNRVAAKIYRASDPSKTPLYTVGGQWNKAFTVYNAQDKNDVVTHDVSSPKAAMRLLDTAEQDRWESRRAWGRVIDCIQKGEMWRLVREKSKLEEAQRAMRRKEVEDGTEWKQKFFNSQTKDPVVESLAAKVGLKSQADKTKGYWQFDLSKAQVATKPYHGDLTPFGQGKESL